MAILHDFDALFQPGNVEKFRLSYGKLACLHTGPCRRILSFVLFFARAKQAKKHGKKGKIPDPHK
ncbi:MAG: hypothetical protein LBL44_04850 [Treponema sp.]|nr:hypothetical protein [Treponema sp.]